MTKKEYCLSHDHISYYSGVGGIEIHGVEGDYIYCTSSAWYPPKNIIKSKFIMIIMIVIILLYVVIKYH